MHQLLIAQSFWTKLDNADKWLFIKLNNGFTHPVLDNVLPFFRDSVFWAPLYLFLLVFITVNFGKKGLYWSFAFICTVAITDLVGTYVFKENVQRLRPCQDPYFFMHVRLLLKQCSGSYSFISNHAANHFGLSMFMFLTFKPLFRRWTYLIFLWAVLIGYAQVYVGVHYPLDIVGGAIVGILAGWLVAWVFNRNVGFISLEK